MAKKRTPNQWGDVFQQMVERNLRNSIKLVEENLGKPDVFRTHFESLMSQAQWGYQRSPELSAHLLLAMHPWPARWALIHAWCTQLELAANTPAIALPLKRQILACLADVYMVAGLSEKTLAIAEGLFLTPANDPQEYANFVMRAGGAFISSLTSQGRLADGEEALRKMEEYLADHAFLPRTVEFGMACAIVRVQRSIIQRRQRMPDQALVTITDAITQLDQSNPRTHCLLYQIIETRAVFHRAAGNYAAALIDLDDAQRQISAGENLALSSLHGNRGLCYWSMSRYAEAEQELLLAIAIAEEHKAYSLMSRQIGPLSLVSFCKGDIEMALRRSERHVELANMIGDVSEKTNALANRYCMFIYNNQAAEALPQLLENLHITMAQGHQEWTVLSYFDLVLAYFYLSDFANMTHYAQLAYDLAKSTENKVLELLAMRMLALGLPQRDAIALLLDVLQIARQRERHIDVASCLLFLAHLETDQVQQAQYWHDAQLILEKIGALRWLENKKIGDPILLPAMM